ncbi:MAG: DUF3575 domain-containing protein [Bacteroides sp.]
MKKILTLLTLFFSLTMSAQSVAIKTNLPYAASLTPNLGIECTLSSSLTFNLEGGLSPFEWKEDKYLKHYLVVPELRYWTCYRYSGFFFGIHGLIGHYNLDHASFLKHRYEGDMYGGGASMGYHFYWSKHWGIEAVVGIGYVKLDYDKYEPGKCAEFIGHFKRDYVGLTRAALSIVYVL